MAASVNISGIQAANVTGNLTQTWKENLANQLQVGMDMVTILGVTDTGSGASIRYEVEGSKSQLDAATQIINNEPVTVKEHKVQQKVSLSGVTCSSFNSEGRDAFLRSTASFLGMQVDRINITRVHSGLGIVCQTPGAQRRRLADPSAGGNANELDVEYEVSIPEAEATPAVIEAVEKKASDVAGDPIVAKDFEDRLKKENAVAFATLTEVAADLPSTTEEIQITTPTFDTEIFANETAKTILETTGASINVTVTSTGVTTPPEKQPLPAAPPQEPTTGLPTVGGPASTQGSEPVWAYGLAAGAGLLVLVAVGSVVWRKQRRRTGVAAKKTASDTQNKWQDPVEIVDPTETETEDVTDDVYTVTIGIQEDDITGV